MTNEHNDHEIEPKERSLGQILADASAEDEAGNVPAQLIPGDPRMKRRLAAMRAGMAETQALFEERDRWHDAYNEEHLKVCELSRAIEQAKEHSDARARKLIDEAITAGKKAEAEAEVLRGEVTRLQQLLRDGEQERARLNARLARQDVVMDQIGRVIAHEQRKDDEVMGAVAGHGWSEPAGSIEPWIASEPFVKREPTCESEPSTMREP